MVKKFKFGIAIALLVCAFGTLIASAYSADNKVAKLYKKTNTSDFEYRYLKMQATYHYSLWDILTGKNKCIIRVHMGQYDKKLPYYDCVYNATRNGSSVTPKEMKWDDSRDPETGYTTYEYYVHYDDRDTTYNVTFLAELKSNMYMSSTLGESKCRYWTGQFYGDIGDDPVYVIVGIGDPVIPDDYYDIR